jgi:hypothetical protein
VARGVDAIWKALKQVLHEQCSIRGGWDKFAIFWVSKGLVVCRVSSNPTLERGGTDKLSGNGCRSDVTRLRAADPTDPWLAETMAFWRVLGGEETKELS